MLTRLPLTRRLSSTLLAITLLGAGHPALAAPPTLPPEPDEATEPTDEPPATEHEVAILRVEAGEDEVILLDGSFARGKVVELTNGSHVTMTVADDSRRIPWEEVQEIRLANAPAQPAAPMPAPSEPPDQVSSEAPSRPRSYTPPAGPRVRIESTNDSLKLYQITGEFVGGGSGVTVSGISYRAVCSGRCGRAVDPGGTYFVGGEGITKSRRFTLTEPGDVTLQVRAGKVWMRMLGLSLTFIGASLLVSGLVMLPLSKSRPEVPRLRKLAIGTTIAGGVSFGIGIPLAVLGRTAVKKR